MKDNRAHSNALNLTKKDIVKKISYTTDYRASDVKNIVNAFIDIVRDNLIFGNNIFLRGLGSFRCFLSKERFARDVKKHATITVPPHVRSKFMKSRFLRYGQHLVPGTEEREKVLNEIWGNVIENNEEQGNFKQAS